MDFRHLERFQPQLLAILRIVTGLLFLEHGLSKFFGFPVPFPVHPLPTLLLAAGAIELVAGLLVTVGLFTRLAAFIASGEMAVAYWMQHFPKSPWGGGEGVGWVRRLRLLGGDFVAAFGLLNLDRPARRKS